MTNSFLGIPIEGDITRGERRAQQRPLEEFAPLLQAVLDDQRVTEFGWYQYTPYFNDGEPCIFRVYGSWFRTDEDEDADKDELDASYHRSLGRRWTGHSYEDAQLTPERAELAAKIRALGDAVDSGGFADYLLRHPKDPASGNYKDYPWYVRGNHSIYARLDWPDTDADPRIGKMLSRELADEAVTAHNAILMTETYRTRAITGPPDDDKDQEQGRPEEGAAPEWQGPQVQ